MNDALHLLTGLDPWVAWILLGSSFVGSFVTVALGIGGGAILLAIMASLMPPLALIPVHGAIQLGSNLFRGLLLLRDVHWPPFLAFAIGTALGAGAGGSVAINLPPAAVQIGVGAFILYSVLSRPPAWLSRAAGVTGFISSFLTMFFGATGVFVANFTKSLHLPRREHVASHAAMMTLQHGLKVAVFALLGFAFGPWVWFILLMIAAGFIGTLVGKQVLDRLSDRGFRRALDVILVLVSVRLIWSGLSALI